jgi:hypothetical protein
MKRPPLQGMSRQKTLGFDKVVPRRLLAEQEDAPAVKRDIQRPAEALRLLMIFHLRS